MSIVTQVPDITIYSSAFISGRSKVHPWHNDWLYADTWGGVADMVGKVLSYIHILHIHTIIIYTNL